MSFLSSIPSPSSGTLDIGPLPIHAYGLMIALGVVAGVWLSGRRLEASGAGSREDMTNIAMWGVFGGVIGARLYYIVTDASEPWREPGKWIQIWKGGLGIPGGLLLGTAAGIWAAKRRNVNVPMLLTAAAPAIPLAQAIGRLGNWFNQELFGRPTTLPWGLEIDDAHLPAGYPSGTLFHPTFLYEALWNLALCGVLILVDKRMRLRPGRLMAVYVAGYSLGRFWVEGLRIDPANSSGGWRLNQWTAVVGFVLAVGYLVIDWARHRNDPAVEPADPAVEPADAVERGDDTPGGVSDDDALVDATPVDGDASATKVDEPVDYVAEDE